MMFVLSKSGIERCRKCFLMRMHHTSYIRTAQRSRKRNGPRAHSRGHSFPTPKTTEEVFIEAAAVEDARLEREVL